MIHLGSLDAWTAIPAGPSATATSALSTPSNSIKLKDLLDFSRTGASPEALFKAVNGQLSLSGAKTTSAVQAEVPSKKTDATTETAPAVFEASLIPGIDKKALETLIKPFNFNSGSKTTQAFLLNPLIQARKVMKGEVLTETEIFEPVLDGLASDAGLDDQTKVAVEQERIKRRQIESQFGKTPYVAVNLKKQAYLQLARHDLQGALKLQEEAVKEEEKKAGKK